MAVERKKERKKEKRKRKEKKSMIIVVPSSDRLTACTATLGPIIKVHLHYRLRGGLLPEMVLATESHKQGHSWG